MMADDYEAPGYWQPSLDTESDEMEETFYDKLTQLGGHLKAMNKHEIHALTPK